MSIPSNSSPSGMQKYHHFEQSQGELRTLPSTTSGEEVHAVGTFNCKTCMCIYARFENGKVFIAHMIAYTDLKDSSPDPENEEDYPRAKQKRFRDRWHVGPWKGLKLKEAVLQQLHSKLGEGVSSEEVVEAFAVCPGILWRQDEQVAVGWFMKEAVREFLGLDELAVRRGHGFVAGPGVKTELFQWEGTDDCNDSRKELRPDHYEWEAVNRVLSNEEVAEGESGPWQFLHDGGRWHTPGS